jgi:hypothetical protein
VESGGGGRLRTFDWVAGGWGWGGGARGLTRARALELMLTYTSERTEMPSSCVQVGGCVSVHVCMGSQYFSCVSGYEWATAIGLV